MSGTAGHIMDKDHPTSTPMTAETVRRDTTRILSEIAGGVDITDPFAAAVRASLREPRLLLGRDGSAL
jgi:hypothetical protein